MPETYDVRYNATIYLELGLCVEHFIKTITISRLTLIDITNIYLECIYLNAEHYLATKFIINYFFAVSFSTSFFIQGVIQLLRIVQQNSCTTTELLVCRRHTFCNKYFLKNLIRGNVNYSVSESYYYICCWHTFFLFPVSLAVIVECSMRLHSPTNKTIAQLKMFLKLMIVSYCYIYIIQSVWQIQGSLIFLNIMYQIFLI